MSVRLCVEVHPGRSPRAAKASSVDGSRCCVVGATPALGQWDPKKSPKLQLKETAASGASRWEGLLEDSKVKPGEEYKLCILNEASNEYVWEEQGPMHVMPSQSTSVKLHFEDAASDATQSEAPSMPQLWEVIGGADKGGIVVRCDRPLSSLEASERLATGAVIEELQLVGERLQYRRKSGSGPETGWVSIELKGKTLARRVSSAAASASVQPSKPEASGHPPVVEKAPLVVTDPSTQLLLKVKVNHARSPRAADAGRMSGTVCCAVGEAPGLGSWDPKRAPKLERRCEEDGTTVWEGVVDTGRLTAGQQFKYCILNMEKNIYVWEEAGPMHVVPSGSEETHDFEDGAQPASGGVGGHMSAWPPPAADAPVTQTGDEVELGDSLVDHWIPWSLPECCPAEQVQGAAAAPRSILHAFHWPFATVTERLQDIRSMGFSAVQISPAQKSKSGHEWWARYQPQDYLQIEGLGSLEDLRDLCARAAELGLMVIGDAVFNHMLVVASGHEWENAQKDEGQLKALKQRLAHAVAPTFEVDDFQWPWFNMSGEHWDNENRYEGWGNGEWSELKYCPKVVDVQQKHLQLLLDAGIRGFRFDAVKHMRPDHLGEHLRFLRRAGSDVFTYGEVLSVDDAMHKEYMTPLKMPSTDFALTVYINEVLRKGVDVAAAGPQAVTAAVAASEGVKVACQGTRSLEPPLLSRDSIRFARNHDTVMNPGSFYGLSGSCQSARLAWVWLLAVHDGSVLVYPDDLLHSQSGPLLQRALSFRAQTSSAVTSEVCLRYAASGGPPRLLVVALRDAAGCLKALCLANLQKGNLRVRTVPLAQGSGGAALRAEDGSTISVQSNGDLQGTVVIPPFDAIFLR